MKLLVWSLDYVKLVHLVYEHFMGNVKHAKGVFRCLVNIIVCSSHIDLKSYMKLSIKLRNGDRAREW